MKTFLTFIEAWIFCMTHPKQYKLHYDHKTKVYQVIKIL